MKTVSLHQHAPPLTLDLFRICLGGMFAAFLLTLAPTWNYYYAADGVLSLTDGNLIRPQDPLSLFTWTENWLPLWVYWWLGLLASLAFMVGWRTRLACLFLYVLQQSMLRRNWPAAASEEIVFRLLFFYGCFATLDARWSMKHWLRNQDAQLSAAAPVTSPRWPIALLQINLALIYVFSVWHKLAVNQDFWRTGSAMYWIMTNTMWARWPWPWMFYGTGGMVLSQAMTYGTLLAEGAFPLMVWFRRTRLLVLTAVIGLHIAIAIALPNVTFFSLAMICGLLTFLPPERLEMAVWRISSGFHSRTRGDLEHR